MGVLDNYLEESAKKDQSNAPTSVLDNYMDKNQVTTKSQSVGTVNATSSTSGLQSDKLMALIQKHFPQQEWDNAYKVAMAESGGNTGAVGDNYPINGETIPSVGVFQIRTLPGRPTPQQLADPDFNVAYAAKMHREQGWQPWTTARRMGLPGTTPLD